MNPTNPAGLLRTIINVVVPCAVGILLVSSFIVSSYVSKKIRAETRLRLTENADRAAQVTANRLDLQRDFAFTLATNKLLVNSIVDTQERERYLPLLFESLRPPGEIEAVVSINDYRGRSIASNVPDKSHESSEWLESVIAGQEHFSLEDAKMVIAVPVLYAGRPEGMIVLEYGQVAVKKLLDPGIDGYKTAVVHDGKTLLSDLDDSIPREMLQSIDDPSGVWVGHITKINNYPRLQMGAFQSTALARKSVTEVNSYLFYASLLSVLALAAGTVLTVRMAVHPLTAMLAKIKATNVASDLSSHLTVEGPREFRSLAHSYNEMLERLQKATVSRERLEAVNEKLERSNTELEEFAYVASHDLQEPLRKVASFCSLIGEEYSDKLDEDGQRYIAYAIDGASRMKVLIQDLLAFSRVETMDSTATEFDATTSFHDAVAQLQMAIEESNATVTSGELPVLNTHKRQFTQLLQNLISNAIKYRSTESPTVHVSVDRADREWVFSVRDNGIGIAPQYHERIFGIFKRLHGHGKYAGTGIGLAICKRIVEQYGGRIWLESEEGKGSQFFFTVPLNASRGSG